MQLSQVFAEMMPHSIAHFEDYARACLEFGVGRHAAFLAQLSHESGGGRWMQEIASGEAYEGRADLGNTQPGDGKRFKGRGPIQLTGRANYTIASEALGLDLVGHPELAATPAVGFRVAAWFWFTHGCEGKSFDAITRTINGGYNGKAQRDALYLKATKLFEIP